MDFLKAEIASKRKAIATSASPDADASGSTPPPSKYARRGDVQRQREQEEQRRRDDERRKKDEVKRLKEEERRGRVSTIRRLTSIRCQGTAS
jgi:pre-mRNA-splicing factor 18